MDHDEYIVKLTKIWATVLIFVLMTLILTIGAYNMYGDYKIGEAIKKGNDPIIARLAFTQGTYERLVYLSGYKQFQRQQKNFENNKGKNNHGK